MDETSLVILFSIILAIIVYIILDLKTEEEEILEDRLKRISQADDTDYISGKRASMYDKMISFYLKKKKMESGKEGSKKDIRMVLMQAGKPYSDDDILRFVAIQALTAIITCVITLLIGVLFLRSNLLVFASIVVVGTMFGYRLPVLILRFKIKQRYNEISYNLPDTLDLLVVCVEAGLGLDAALTRVANEQMRTAPVLAREIGRVTKDIMAGVPREEAFRNLAIRNDVPDLKSLVALMIQTIKLGTSISQSLRIYSETVRTNRRQKAEKLAAEASVKMVIPLVLFILPSMFVVLMGPAILNLIEQFGGRM